MIKYVLRCVLLACLVAGLSTGAYPAAAPSAFGQFATYGITASPTNFVSGQLTYELTLDSGAYILYGENKYPVVSIWGFYAVNKSDASTDNFIASGPDYGEWDWDQHPNSGGLLNVGGWLDSPKKEALLTPESGSVSKSFTFTQLSFTGAAPVLGLHVSISIPEGLTSPFTSGGVTSDIIPVPVPEPSGLIALFSGAIGLFGVMAKRYKQI